MHVSYIDGRDSRDSSPDGRGPSFCYNFMLPMVHLHKQEAGLAADEPGL